MNYDYFQLEEQDGVRMVWNNLPSNKISATRAVIPPAIHYTPYKDIENLIVLQSDPLRCKCSAVLNPYCQVDFNSKQWLCPFCFQRNPFTQLYRERISPQQLPHELQQTSTTIEYEQDLNKSNKLSPHVYIFVIDTCIPQSEMDALKDSIQQSLDSIPQDAYIGLITFGRYVFVHELGFQECPKSFALKGSKTYTPQQIQEMLGLRVGHDPRGPQQNSEMLKRFMLKLEDCQFTFSSIIDNLQPDPWKQGQEERQQRATGTALNVALSMAESIPFQGTRIMNFLGGPCTVGPGQVVDIKLVNTIRSFYDMQNNNDLCKFVKPAKKYYQALTQRAIKIQCTVDFYAYSVDQVGLLEMKCMSERTGGYTIMNEEFNSTVFQNTYKKIFDLDQETNELKMVTGAKLDMFMSKEIKINGALGNLTSYKKTGPSVSEIEIGQGGTTQWFCGGLDRTQTFTFMLDYNPQFKDQNNSNKMAYFQFQTFYKSPTGKMVLRVTTIARRYADNNNIYELSEGFDQEAACVTMARHGIWKAEQEESLEVLKWLDRTLIKLVTKFGNYTSNQPSTFSLSQKFELYPQMMYHLRRSHFISTFGASPDETTFYRVTMNRENVTNCLVMVQPALLCYQLDQEEPTPVNLDSSALQKDIILLLDTYFQIITWKGNHIKKWVEEGYHEQEDYSNLKELLQKPLDDANFLMEERFPEPVFYETHEGHSKERFLKSRVNPSGQQQDAVDDAHYITDDASMKLFMDHLIKLAVQPQN